MKIQRLKLCRALHINTCTFDRAVKAGKLVIEHDASSIVAGKPGTFVELSEAARWRGISEDELTALLTEPQEPVSVVPEVQAVASDAPQVNVERNLEEPLPDIAEPDAFAPRQATREELDAEFAAAYQRGEATDSAGNNIMGSNDRWPSKGVQTLLGPVEPQVRQRLSTTSHMDAALVGDPAIAAPNPVDSDEFMERWHPGHTQRKADMYAQAGLKQPSEQDQKKAVDRAAIAAAFRMGYSR